MANPANVRTLQTVLALALVSSLYAHSSIALGQTFSPPAIFREIADGKVLTNELGMSLYVQSTEKTPGSFECAGACANTWRPFYAKGTPKVAAPWSLVARAEGAQQWAYEGKTLYTYAGDEKPGHFYGDDVDSSWRAVFVPMQMPPTVSLETVPPVRLLADKNGRTLYLMDEKAARQPLDSAKMDPQWTPFQAPAIAKGLGDWTVSTRTDGLNQWLYKKQPVYQYAGDYVAGDMNGVNTPIMRPAIVRQARWMPESFRLQQSEVGLIYARHDGAAVYFYSGTAQRLELFCDNKCMQEYWKPVVATQDEVAHGRWSIMNSGNTKVWAYDQRILYTFKRDKHPSEIRGLEFAFSAAQERDDFKVVKPPL